MKDSFARNFFNTGGRMTRRSYALGVTIGLVASTAVGQSQRVSSPPEAHRDSPRRARSLPREAAPQRLGEKDDDDTSALIAEGEDGELGAMEKRFRDLSTKVDELRDLLEKRKANEEATHFALRPVRARFIERAAGPKLRRTQGEALEALVGDRLRTIRKTLDHDAARAELAVDPEPLERERLLRPVYGWIDAQGTEAEHLHAELVAFVYLSLLETRMKLEPAEPLPALHKVLHDLHVDRAALAEHLRTRFLTDDVSQGRDLPIVLRAVAATYPDLQGMREFLGWVATGVGADMWQHWETQCALSYDAEPASQFAAAAENAVVDDGDVLKLQIELQRMSVEAKALDRHEATASIRDWQTRLLRAERDLDRLLRAADSEREAVTTLARHVPVAPTKVEVAEPRVDPRSLERSDVELATDELATQH